MTGRSLIFNMPYLEKGGLWRPILIVKHIVKSDGIMNGIKIISVTLKIKSFFSLDIAY